MAVNAEAGGRASPLPAAPASVLNRGGPGDSRDPPNGTVDGVVWEAAD